MKPIRQDVWASYWQDLVSVNSQLLGDAITHLFLPKKTPGTLPSNLLEIEDFLLEAFGESVNKTLSEIPFPELEPTRLMLKKWNQLQILQDVVKRQDQFQKQVTSLEKGDTIPIYIRQQNCTLLVTKSENNEVIVSTFRSALPAKAVMSTVGSHSLTFPETSEPIQNRDFLHSKSFSKLIHELTFGDVEELSLATTKKGGNEYLDTRDAVNPRLVMDWIVGLLVPAQDKIPFQLNYSIKKKIRDQVSLSQVAGSSQTLPFRRSGMYMALKVTVQLKLLENLGAEEISKYVYKILMLRILTDVVNKLCNKNQYTNSIDMDVSSQILAKIGRRVRKLENFQVTLQKSEMSQIIIHMRDKCMAYTESVVTRLNEQMQKYWNHVVHEIPSKGDMSNNPAIVLEEKPTLWSNVVKGKPKSEVVKQALPVRSIEAFPEITGESCPKRENCLDLQHQMPSLGRYIARVKNFFSENAVQREDNSTSDFRPFKRYLTLTSIKESQWLQTENEKRTWLFDTENYIKYYCTEKNTKAPEISQLVTMYVSKAKDLYENNPLGMSQILLVSLKGFQILDKITTKAYPLLLEYKPELNIAAFDHLLLPYHKDMKLLEKLLNFFGTRDRNAVNSEILRSSVNSNSFSVRFAKQDGSMRNLRQRILDDTEETIEKKYSELNSVRKRCEDLQTEIRNEGGCSCEYETKTWINRYGKHCWRTERVFHCRKCKLEIQLQTLRKSVSFYEKPLPHQETFQHAVIFELLLPKIYSIWRDYVAYFKYFILGEPVFNTEVSIKWLEYRKLSGYSTDTAAGNPRLGSVSLPASATYHTAQNLDVLSSKNESFIVNNGMSCHFNYTSQGTVTSCWITACAFKLSSTLNYGPYAKLQKTVDSTTHFQNKVIARQNNCHEKLALPEFIAFGSLRAGHRIQLRNLYEAIFSGILSLEQEPVLALVLQTIWQVGPRDKDNRAESHFDFMDPVFAKEFVEMLNKVVKTNEANYSNALIVLIAVVITRRIADLNTSVEQLCYDFLRQWRKILRKWIRKIQWELSKSEVVSVQDGTTSLRKNLLEIVLSSLFSFSIADESNLSAVIKDEHDFVQWLETLYQLNQFDDQPVSTSGFTKLLVNFTKLLPLRLQLEGQFQKRGDPENIYERSLHSFICQRWSNAKQCTLKRIECPSSGNVVLVEYLDSNFRRHHITFDLILGIFLVNGYSQSEMPRQIRENKLFKWYFKDATNLRVQQDSRSVTRTVTKYHGKHYIFHRSFDDTDGVVIQEIHDDGTNLVLVYPTKLVKQISDYFLVNHTHWLDLNKSIVYFRPRNSTSPENQQQDNSHEYILEKSQGNKWNQNSWQMYDIRSDHFVLGIFSNGFSEFGSILMNFELPKFINVTMAKDGVKTAHLRRYHLRFTLKPGRNGHFESVEYPGYFISKNQTYKGTLIGLRQGLLLENNEKRLFLVPHSTIQISHWGHHQVITLPLEQLRQPPCFDYEFDDVLKRLKARNNKSAWIYLAALHASTSSCLPDPFTGITGTEMAMRILQSACVWSCSPYDIESVKTLMFIVGLSPKRKYYGKEGQESGSMESVDWSIALPSMAAFDGYAIIVQKLLSDGYKLSMLHTISPGDQKWLRSALADVMAPEILRIRAYHQHLPMYSPAVSVLSPYYFPPSHLSLLDNSEGQITSISLRASSQNLNIDNLQVASFNQLGKTLGSMKHDGHFQKDTLSPFLLQKEPLDAPIPTISINGYGAFHDLLHLEFRYNWLKLYSLAVQCNKSKGDQTRFAIILSTLAYRGAPMQEVANLHCISVCASKAILQFPQAPLFQKTIAKTYFIHDDPTLNDFEVKTVEEILNRHPKPFTALPRPVQPTRKIFWNVLSEEDKRNKEKYENDLKEYVAMKEAFEERQRIGSAWLSPLIRKKFWPCECIRLELIGELLESYDLKAESAVEEINTRLAIWFRNYQLKLFIQDVQGKLNEIYDSLQNGTFQEITTLALTDGRLFPRKNYAKVEKQTGSNIVDISELVDLSLASKQDEVARIFESGNFQTKKHKKRNTWEIRRQRCQLKVEQVNNEIVEMITSNVFKRIIFKTGICPRLDPESILKYLARDIPDYNAPLAIIKDYAGALAVLWSHEKRINRCIRAQSQADIQRENKNPGHENWSPKEYPEWLLLELELDIMIRPIQVNVATQMMTMPGGRNGVTQLNMGEGKTSVIVPMLCSTLAKRNIQLCRVTVLSSMFKMNLTSLTFSIGGLLNQRLYSVPCRRDMKIGDTCVAKILEAYQECVTMKGVVLTLPEYRLSFRLLAYDKIFKNECALGQKMLGIENWLRKHARDVLDESDELFNVKYQLVYTIGTQIPLDGGDLRWTICQKMLALVLKVAPTLLNDFGTSNVEFDPKIQKASPHHFSTFRLLSTSCMDTFLELLADKILEEKRLHEEEKQIVKRFLVECQVTEDDHRQVMETIFKDNPDELQEILLLSGYLRRGVLGLALLKRWRVEYGVNPKQGFRRMAVPFRAKDVAAEKTEFGHPDLAIILTHLSYYYSGLDNSKLQEVFDILKGKQVPEDIYSDWIARIGTDVPDFLLKYHNLNMKDAYQKSKLFELLEKHKMVIDFWLAHCVFPRESKQFPRKLVMTAWDLCYERQQYPVTGFSGTNDSQVLLPLMISQQDLPELLDTNENMERTLLQPENGNHKGFKMGVTCKEILKTMMEDELTVLIDAGALMLECSNEQVAVLWLEVNQEIEAVVYFSKNNELLVKCRGEKGFGTPFDVSPYQGRLDKCGVFLDDQHTRGTDLKFPVGSKACVTIATRMKRDKLIQACMRMRKLGNGHSVTFYLSHEAHDKVLPRQEDHVITTQLVLAWVCGNTEQSNDDGLLYWALAGRNYAQRLAAEDNLHWPHHKSPFKLNMEDSSLEVKAGILAKQCVDDEVVKLMDMYGQHTQIELLSKLIPIWFAITKKKLQRKNGGQVMNARILKEFDETCEAIRDKCLERVPTKTHVSSSAGGMMEEEQEKELELEKETEVEEERQVERPRKADAATHHLHPNVERIVLYGSQITGVGEGIQRMPDMFRGTTFWKEVQPQCWDAGVFVTDDFCRTIQGSSLYFKTDSYLRPILYLVSFNNANILILSPYEVNELMPYFRSGQANAKLHMFSLRRSVQQDLLLNKGSLQLPSSDDEESVSEDSRALASFLLASGSLYFISMEEQKAFARFLGLVPQPWSVQETKAFDKGMISKGGFLLPEYRHLFARSSGRGKGEGFDKDPTTLVKHILKCRHPVVSQVTHIMKLLEEKRYVEME